MPKYRRSDINTPALPEKSGKGWGTPRRKDDATGWASPQKAGPATRERLVHPMGWATRPATEDSRCLIGVVSNPPERTTGRRAQGL